MKIKIVNKSKHPLPEYKTKSSAGLDIRANIDEPIMLKSLERKLVPTGLFIELPDGYEAQMRPRSGLALNEGITLLNTPGTIDADYRGEIGVILVNLSHEVTQINDGDRICQMVINKVEQAELIEVEELGETERGRGGFGHTGKHNQALLDLVQEIAERKNATSAQIVLAWEINQKDWIVPIPGTTKIHRLEENLGAMEVELTEQEMAAINQALDNLDIDETHF